MPPTSKQLRRAWLDWLSLLDVEDAVGGTITFKRSTGGRPISVEEATKAIRMFHRILDRKAYGNQARKNPDCRLVFVAVNEGGREAWEKEPHVHFFCEVPQYVAPHVWVEAVTKVFEKIRWFGSDHCEVKPVIDKGWIDYMLKVDTKHCYADAIDVLSMWTKSQST